MPKYYIIAGERSGDLHAANLMRALKVENPNIQFVAWGGDEMQKVSGNLVVHYREMAFMGLWEVIKNIFTIGRYLNQCKNDILKEKPDAMILVDYAGFNMKIAAFAKKNGIKVFYYISPKVWAWRSSRALKVKQKVDEMFVIMPFEKSFYKKFDFDVHYVGNPLLDEIKKFVPNPNFLTEIGITNEKPIIALLPGSRHQEVSYMLEMMDKIAQKYANRFTFVVAGVNSLPKSMYDICKQKPHLRLIFDQTYDLLHVANSAIVTSGTATLETCLFNVPQVMCYKTSWLTYEIGVRLVEIEMFSLPNLIADEKVIEELIQHEYNLENLEKSFLNIVQGVGRDKVKIGYQKIFNRIGEAGASERTAKLIMQLS